MKSRLLTHSKALPHEAASFSTACLPEGSTPCQLLEAENDIIAALFMQTSRVPRLQFGGVPSHAAGQ
jgi:hypothetical protein